jgi:leader peptidase (prepilin peptidase)/N-methyltransferase
MSTVVGVALAALIGALLGLAVPRITAAVPEPVPEPAPEPVPEPALAEGEESAEGAEGERDTLTDEEPPKELYAQIAQLPWLPWVSVLLSAVMGGLFGWSTGFGWPLVWLLPLTPILVALSVLDARTKLLPKILVLPPTGLIPLLMLSVDVFGDQDNFVRAVIAMVVVRTFHWILWFINSAGLGFGDVRYSALLGLVLGWVSWGAVAIGTMVALLSFSLVPLVILAITRDRKVLKRALPYGPFMTFGAVVGLVWGPQLTTLLWG